MGKQEARLKEGTEHESRIGEFRTKYNLGVEELAKICECSKTNIVRLQNGTMSPFYERARTIKGTSYNVGDVRPYVEKMSFLFAMTVPELFPRYACEFDRKDNLLVYLEEMVDINDEGSTVNNINNKLVFEKFWGKLDSWLTPREKDVLEKRFLDGLILEDIGKEYGTGRERIKQIRNKALKRTRGRLGSTLELKKFKEDLKSCIIIYKFRKK